MTIKYFKIPIYHGRLIVVKAKSIKKACNRFGYKADSNNYEGMSLVTTGKDGCTHFIVIFKPQYFKAETIVHEALHTTNNILQSCGIKTDYDNDEAQAYMLNWVVSKILKLRK